MKETTSYLKGMYILAVDDEVGILETIEDVLDESRIDRATNYADASQKIKETDYDLAILDIMGVDGLKLLEETVDRGIPTVMLTAHALNPETLKISLRKGALAYLPKEELVNLDEFLNEMFATINRGESPWKLLFRRLGDFFARRFGPKWDEEARQFWDEIEKKHRLGYSNGSRIDNFY